MKENDLINFMYLLADEASKVTLKYFNKNINVSNKSHDSFDPVTVADNECELKIKSLIKDKYPDHGFRGEESENHYEEDEPHWVVDPIDGTRAFITGIPVWGTLIAYNDGNIPVNGLVDQPFLKNRFISYENQSFFLKDNKKFALQTRNINKIEDATLTTTDPFSFAASNEWERYNELCSRVKMRRFGLDCMGFCQLILGTIDAVVEANLQAYDIQALIPLIRNAGGEVSTFEGEDPSNGGNIIASGSMDLHDKLLEFFL